MGEGQGLFFGHEHAEHTPSTNGDPPESSQRFARASKPFQCSGVCSLHRVMG